MASFKQIHKEFVAALLVPSAPIPKGLIAVKKPNITSRFAVYRNNVIVGLIAALKSNFPICFALVGDEFFKALAIDFIRKDPPTSPMLFEYGDEFALFISQYSPADQLPYLADIARLEIMWRNAYHAIDAKPLDITKIQQIDAKKHSNLTFKTHPSAAILTSDWPIYSIWQGHEDNNMLDIDLEVKQSILICRPNVDVLIANIDPAACIFYSAIMNGQSLGSAYEKAIKQDQNFDFNYCFGQLFALGLITDIVVEK
ncbi:MAG: DNA-binding domain-containing protein [Devosiaceae bacterium]|nr:DNA-binding domain-containing protein [Devosiaceae bacterium]